MTLRFCCLRVFCILYLQCVLQRQNNMRENLRRLRYGVSEFFIRHKIMGFYFLRFWVNALRIGIRNIRTIRMPTGSNIRMAKLAFVPGLIYISVLLKLPGGLTMLGLKSSKSLGVKTPRSLDPQKTWLGGDCSLWTLFHIGMYATVLLSDSF